MSNYSILSLEAIEPAVLNSFSELPDDRYLKDDFAFRSRRYHTGTFSKQAGTQWDSDTCVFEQSSKLNRYVGGVSREFDPMKPIAKGYIEQSVLPLLMGKLDDEKEYSFGVHQIRIKTNDEFMGKPAPEGIHQDGFDYIAVVCMALDNIAGGDSILVDAKNRDEVLCDYNLKPGEVLFFDDKRYAHYVSPLVPKLPGNGARDVFVVTMKEQ